MIDSRKQGVETNIYRLGNLQCDSRTGLFQKNEENNAFYSVIKSFKKLEKFPELPDDSLEFTPVDQAAEACSTLIKNNQLTNEIHHIYNTHHLTLTQLMNVYNQHDYHIENIQWNDFMDFLMECIEQGIKSDEINDFLLHTGILDNNMFNKSHFEVLDFKTNYILEKLNFEWKPTDNEILSKMISHPKIISKQQLRQQILICCFNCFANTKCGSDTVEVTVYLLDTSDSIYQNKRCNAKYSELFKCFCVKAATGHEIDDIAFKTGDYGKPLLYRPYNKHLNISHTDGFRFVSLVT